MGLNKTSSFLKVQQLIKRDITRLDTKINYTILLTIAALIVGAVLGGVGIAYPKNSGGNSEFFCTSNSMCTDFEITSVCFGAFCNETSGQCFTDWLNSTFDCNEDTICGAGEVCRGCTCQPDPCLNVDEVLVCSTTQFNNVTEECDLILLPGSECENDNLCPGILECRNCTCVPPPGINGTISCIDDSTCQNVTSTNRCIVPVCDLVTETCDTAYGPGFDCNGADDDCDDPSLVCRDCVCTDLCAGVTCDSDACTTSECDPKTGTCVVTNTTEGCCLDSSTCINITATNECLVPLCETNECTTDYGSGFDC